MEWLYNNWFKSTIFLAIYLSLPLSIFVMNNDYALFLIWIQTVVYFLHQFEEYVLPGGFKEFFNTKVLGSQDKDFPLDKKVSFWINIPIIYIGFPLSAVLSGFIDLSFGIWTAYFSIINALSHIGMFFIHRYNPGFFISLFLNIPVGIYTIHYFTTNQLISFNAHIMGLGIGLFLQGIIMAYGFKVLKEKIQ